MIRLWKRTLFLSDTESEQIDYLRKRGVVFREVGFRCRVWSVGLGCEGRAYRSSCGFVLGVVCRVTIVLIVLVLVIKVSLCSIAFDRVMVLT